MQKEPYRLFFPLGTIFLLWGSLLWLPQIWNPGDYPVQVHRYLMLNGFTACFICGFLMTAVPKFSQTMTARKFETILFLFTTLIGLILCYFEQERLVLAISAIQASIILFFLFSRIFKRKVNPPYSFVFIFVGLLLWLVSSVLSIFFDMDSLKILHYEGAIAAIILGVGSRLIPGILGHVEIVNVQRERYEKPISILATVPLAFVLLMMSFVLSYFLPEFVGGVVRVLVIGIVSFKYWLLWKGPVNRSAFTWCVWLAGWLILLSFLLKAIWPDGLIHASHAFFINGIVLLSLLIATRVLVSHGPQIKELENNRVLYVMSFLLILSSATRVSAYLLPEMYLTHLGYSALLFVIAVVLWAGTYLKYVLITK